jgi:hypothetical protein
MDNIALPPQYYSTAPSIEDFLEQIRRDDRLTKVISALFRPNDEVLVLKNSGYGISFHGLPKAGGFFMSKGSHSI